jgi:glycosyltransferase involved in cell wall biosynthesis
MDNLNNVCTANSVWIVIAAYNEGSRLASTLKAIAGQASVVVVDDGSRDNTCEVACAFPVWRLRHVINCGQGAALQTGIDFALKRDARFIVTFDADGQHDPADIPKLLAPLQRGDAEIALGSRFLGTSIDIPRHRWLLLKAAVVFTRIVSNISVTDTHNGLRAFTRAAASQIRITQDRMAHASEILDEIRRNRLRYCEVPVTIHYTPETLAKGQSSWNAVRITGQFVLGRFVR